MKKQKEYTVVVMDDKKVCCERIARKLAGARRLDLGDTEISIAVKTVHIGVRREKRTEKPQADSWTFQNEIVDKLREAAEANPDLMIVDYISIDEELASYFMKRALETQVEKEEIEARALNPHDLRRWIETSPDIDKGDRDVILKKLFGFRGPLYLHTYTPQGLTVITGNIEERGRYTSLAFPNARITVVDTHSELFESEVFDWPNPKSHYDPDYYPYQLATYFDQVAQKEVFRAALEKSRFIVAKRSSHAVGLICIVGATVGFASAWTGDLVSYFVRENSWLWAIGVFLLCLGAMVGAGFSLPFWFDKLMRQFVREE